MTNRVDCLTQDLNRFIIKTRNKTYFRKRSNREKRDDITEDVVKDLMKLMKPTSEIEDKIIPDNLKSLKCPVP